MAEIDFENSLYVGSALTEATQDFRDDIAQMRVNLANVGINVLHFRGLGNGTPEEIYTHDNGLVQNCSGMLAVFSPFRSPGLIGEVQTARLLRKPTLAIELGNSKDLDSSYLRGLLRTGRYPIIRVESLDEVPKIVLKRLVEFDDVIKLTERVEE